MKKNMLRKVIVLVLGFLGLLALAGCGQQPARAQTPEDSANLRTISVRGVGQVSGKPDQAIIRLGVQTEAVSASEALSENSQNMQAVIDTFSEAGVASENIQTQTIRLNPRYEQPVRGEGERELVGYIAVNTVEVRVENLDRLGEMLDAAVEAGGNTIENIRFEISDSSELLDQAREAAMNNAQHKAEQLVALVDARLDQVQTINETSRVPQPVVTRGDEAALEAAVPIQPGSQTMQVEVQVTWLLGE